MYFTNRISIITLTIITLLIVALLIIKNGGKINAFEKFFNDANCSDCNFSGWRRKDYCQSCGNCGWSVGQDGFGQCLPGNKNGPISNLNTKDWHYGGKHIWRNSTLPRPHLHTTKSPEAVIYNPRLHYTPFWKVTHKNRMRNDYGSLRYGRRFGYGWNQQYEEQRF